MTLQDCLEYCQKQNGLDYCKNCGLTATIIHQNLAEDRARVRGVIEFVKTNIAWHRTQGIEADSGDDARQIGWDGACDLILSSLDKPLKDNK